MQGWSVLCSGRFDRVMLLLLHREGATSGRQQKTTSPRACGPSEGEAGYPRVCGATPPLLQRGTYGRGPSPRVRGNLLWEVIPVPSLGPIPACAGQPASRRPRWLLLAAHPRVCGATQAEPKEVAVLKGPSPRVRGNRHGVATHDGVTGPIPACAGQPLRTHLGLGSGRAHPRVCGATQTWSQEDGSYEGPSPRVRGNL